MTTDSTFDKYNKLGVTLYQEHMHKAIKKMVADLPVELRSALYTGVLSAVATNMYCDTSQELTTATLQALTSASIFNSPSPQTKH